MGHPRPGRALLTAGAMLAMLPSVTYALPPGPPLGADSVATLSRATTVGATGGWTVWSEYRAGSYRLVVRSPEGVVTTPPIASRRVPFDVDLGRDGSGRVVATFSRCKRHEPTLVGGANASAPNYATGRGCRISLLDLATAEERRLGRSRGSGSDVLPSMGAGRIAFVAIPKPRASGGRAELRWRTAGDPHSRLLDRGTWRGGRPNVAGGPAAVDTDGRRVAVVWRGLDEQFNSFDSVLRVQRYGAKARQVAYGTNNDVCNYDQVLAPTLQGTTVSYLESSQSEWVLGRTSVARQAPSFGVGRTGEPGVVVTSAALDGTRLVVAETAAPDGVGHAVGPTTVRELTTGTFGRTSPVSFCE